MPDLYARAVFFVSDAASALAFYTQSLGFEPDWTHRENGRPYVFQVKLFGFELILNQTDAKTAARAGAGRVFIGCDEDQAPRLIEHIRANKVAYRVLSWGKPTLMIQDMDGNEILFWGPNEQWEVYGPEFALPKP